MPQPYTTRHPPLTAPPLDYFTGWEIQNYTADFTNYLYNLTTDYFSIDTAVKNGGAASLLFNKVATVVGNQTQRLWRATAAGPIASSCFHLYPRTMPSNNTMMMFHSLKNENLPTTGLGFYTDGSGNSHLCLMDVVTGAAHRPWAGSVNLTLNTWYIVQHLIQPGDHLAGVAALNGLAYVILRDSTGAVLEQSGPVTVTLSNGDAVNNLDFGVFGGNGGMFDTAQALQYNIDNVFVTVDGTMAPYGWVVPQVANNAEGSLTAWTLGAGATKWGAVSEALPPDEDTSYIKATAGGQSQTFNATASGITLGAGQTILGLVGHVRARAADASTGMVAGPRWKVNSVAKALLNTTWGGLTAYSWSSPGVWLPPSTGWTVAMIDGMELGIGTSLLTSADRRCTYIMSEVAYGVINPSPLLYPASAQQAVMRASLW